MTINKSDTFQAIGLVSANAREFVSAILNAYREGTIAAILPEKQEIHDIPCVELIDRRHFTDEGGWIDGAYEPLLSDDPAQIVFSSGTTGAPKPFLLTHRALADVTLRLNSAMQVDGDIREYLGAPVNYAFGFGRCRAVAAAGGAAYLPPHGFNPSEFASMLRDGEVNAASGVPTIWRIALANADVIGDAGRHVKWIEIGSQYMSIEEKQAMRQLFPNAKILLQYGLTEASRSTFLDVSGTDGMGLDSIGRAVGDVAVKLSDDQRIMIRGPHIAKGVLTASGLRPITDDDGWLTTNDIGRLDDGWLFFGGRGDDLINCGGTKIDPEKFEQTLAGMLGVANQIAVGRLDDAMRGERILIAILKGSDLDRAALKSAASDVAASYGLTGSAALTFAEIEELPRTDTGKLQRRRLADIVDFTPARPIGQSNVNIAGAPTAPTMMSRAAPHHSGVGEQPNEQTSPMEFASDPEQAGILSGLWADALGHDQIGLDESFFDLGGDSLSAINLVVRMERAGIDAQIARGIFEGRTLREILSATQQRPADDVDTSTPTASLTAIGAANAAHATRGVLVAIVVGVHWLPGLLARISDDAPKLLELIEPFLRLGTPGFALVFGVGVGAFRTRQFERNRPQFYKTVRRNASIVLVGALIVALFRGGQLWTDGLFFNPIAISNIFYNVLAYFVLICATEGLIMRTIMGPDWSTPEPASSEPILPDQGGADDRQVFLRFLGLAAIMLIIHEILYFYLADLKTTGVVDLVRILMIAKYGYFKMTAAVLIGAAIGWRFRRQYGEPRVVSKYAMAGATTAAFGALFTLKAQPAEILLRVPSVEPWHLTFYAGLVLLLLALFSFVNKPRSTTAGNNLIAPVHIANRLLIVTGMLALPIFVLHELVLPAKGMLVAANMPAGPSLAGVLLIFLAIMAIAYWRFLRLVAR